MQGFGIFDRPNFGDLYIEKKTNNWVKMKNYNMNLNMNENIDKCISNVGSNNIFKNVNNNIQTEWY